MSEKLSDWNLFVEIAKRLGASTSGDEAGSTTSVNDGDRVVRWDEKQRRAYYVDISSPNPSRWLDNNILTWIDTLFGRLGV
jgi:hypothetical protein